MSLTFGPGPFSHQRAGVFSTGDPARGTVYAEPYPRRVRALRRGEVVLDSERGWMLHEPGNVPVLWFPADDINSVALPQGSVDDFAPGQGPVATALSGFQSLTSGAADRWFIEDEPVYSHVRDPYHRVDVVSSHRHVVVEHAGIIIADTTRPKMLFETGLPPRYYLPWADVRVELFDISATVSECPYKGDGQHWHLRHGTGHVPDAAWSLPHPLPEGIPAAEHLSFYQDKVSLTVDDVPLR